MRKWMKCVYSGFHDIGVIGESFSKRSYTGVFPTMTRESLVSLDPTNITAGIIGSNPVDLIIIDLDAFGVEKARFIVFLSGCFAPQTPLVLVTEHTLPQTTRRTLHTGQVLGIIELNNSVGVPGPAYA